jgi:hypothetical protein
LVSFIRFWRGGPGFGATLILDEPRIPIDPAPGYRSIASMIIRMFDAVGGARLAIQPFSSDLFYGPGRNPGR